MAASGKEHTFDRNKDCMAIFVSVHFSGGSVHSSGGSCSNISSTNFPA